MSGPSALSPEARADMQGLLASGYGHLPFAAYLFLQVESMEPARAWLRSLVPEVATSAPWRRLPGGGVAKPASALNLAVTFAGLRALGLSPSALCTFPEEFREGIAHPRRAKILGDTEDSAPEAWEFGGPGHPEIHLLLVLHALSKEALEAFRGDVRARMASSGGVVELPGTAQEGERPSHGKEPFGFTDGIAQPDIEGLPGPGIAAGEFILGYRDQYGFVPPGPVVPAADDSGGLLPADSNPHHPAGRFRDLGMHGSYVVYRKLRQDVAGFWRFAVEEAEKDRGRPDPLHAVLLAAKLVGRWPSGAPMALSPERDNPGLRNRDDFGYAGEDANGLGCPLGAHVRRMHPRDFLPPCGPRESTSISSSHRLLRRGRIFGPPLFDPTVLDGAEDAARLAFLGGLREDGELRGIHFLALGASIRRQFEFVQQTWANNHHFGGLADNKDPLIGDNDRPAGAVSFMTIPRHPVRWRTSALPRFVVVRAGAYFFLPGIRSLRFLAGG